MQHRLTLAVRLSVMVVLLGKAGSASAQSDPYTSYATVYNFAGINGVAGIDGSTPGAGTLAEAGFGALAFAYGTTQTGGSGNGGTIYSYRLGGVQETPL